MTTQRAAKWIMVGAGFMLFNLPVLHVLVELLKIPMLAATAVSALIAGVLRFLVNDRFVFGNQRPAWRRFVRYCGAVTGGFVIWYATTNIVAAAGVHYLAAAAIGTACSAGFAFASNFGWVWRIGGMHKSAEQESAAGKR